MMISDQYTKNSLLSILKDREIVIWGARMTGIGFSRFLKANKCNEAISFIDSDKSLHEKSLNQIPINSPLKLKEYKKQYPNLLIVVAVALKEQDIIENIKELGISDNNAYIIYSDYCKDFYTIDVVGTCNLACPSCPHGATGMESPLGLMSFENFEKVVEKALKESEVVSHVSLYSWGEPLLHKDLSKMIEYLHERGIAVALSTNLSTSNVESVDAMIKAKPDYLKISTSGFYDAVYNDTHTGGNVYLVKSNLYRIKYWIDKYKSSTLVDVNYHLYNNNCGKNLEKMQELCEELGFSLSTTYSLIMPLERVIDFCDGKQNDEFNLLNDKLLVKVEEGINASSKVSLDGDCPFRANQVNINWDLSVPVCCTVFSRNPDTIVTSNYLEMTLEDITKCKQKVSLCNKCINLKLPEYNMGFNQAEWKSIASKKGCLDI